MTSCSATIVATAPHRMMDRLRRASHNRSATQLNTSIITGPLDVLANTMPAAETKPISEHTRWRFHRHKAIGTHIAPTLPAKMACANGPQARTWPWRILIGPAVPIMVKYCGRYTSRVALVSPAAPMPRR